ncbi:hypothetical protein [Kineococcus sp. G2]|uniref:Orn/Lys/Arg family decarboxylase n=1 Tax=Kineococcus sp. G2 TaxID=3127484 RepID=UPI00301D358B
MAPQALAILGEQVFAADVLTLNGLDDRRAPQGVTSQAEELTAGAVGADKAFFPTCARSVPVESAGIQAVGRIAAGAVSPYPPGVPALTPGEALDAQAVDNLRSGVAAGMLIPGAADASMGTLRVVAR